MLRALYGNLVCSGVKRFTVGGIRISQIVSITLAAVGLIWLLIGTFARKNPQREG